MAALASFGTTSPRYKRQQDMYLPVLGSHLTSCPPTSKHAFVSSETERLSWKAFSAEMMGAYVASGKWIRGYGTKFVWNSFKSTLSEPSNRSEAVMDDTTLKSSVSLIIASFLNNNKR